VGRLNAENPLIPVGIMLETDVFNFEIGLTSLPFRRPGQMHLIKLPTKLIKFGLPKSGNFDLVWVRENGLEHGDPA
jgi:hypothetical protein